MNNNKKVWVLSIYPCDKATITVHSSKDGATKELFEYCKSNWSEDLAKEYKKLSTNQTKAIKQFFEFFDEEYANIEEHEVKK